MAGLAAGCAGALMGLAAMVGCDGGPDSAVVAAPSAAPAGCRRPAPGTAASGSALVPGPTNGLPRSTAVGEPLVIEAVVLDRGCRPAHGAELDVWHTDAGGRYGPADNCCYYGGNVRTDAHGRFRLQTIRPAQYPEANAPPAHIHLDIRHGPARLETEIVFGLASPPAMVTPTGGQVPVVLRREGDGWRGDVAFVL
jgi:hypothetical protein